MVSQVPAFTPPSCILFCPSPPLPLSWTASIPESKKQKWQVIEKPGLHFLAFLCYALFRRFSAFVLASQSVDLVRHCTAGFERERQSACESPSPHPSLPSIAPPFSACKVTEGVLFFAGLFMDLFTRLLIHLFTVD
mmetsp:Transcript_36699/g.72209  ORF Transcript_36699/g.72209 Transcript_36699/m.72209 type:complete len:136 (+) Transcript_36699:773-1180(+)